MLQRKTLESEKRTFTQGSSTNTIVCLRRKRNFMKRNNLFKIHLCNKYILYAIEHVTCKVCKVIKCIRIKSIFKKHNHCLLVTNGETTQKVSAMKNTTFRVFCFKYLEITNSSH